MDDNLRSLNEEILLKSVLDTVNDGVTVIDRDLRVIFHNEAIRRKYGDITGQVCYKAYRKRDEPCDGCTILEVLKDGKQRTTLRDTVQPGGNVLWMECSCGPLKDADGNVVGVVEIVRNVTEQINLSKENVTLRREIERQVQFENIITQSKKIKTIFKLIERVAPTASSVLMTGESGTGKELFAKAIWANSNRKDKPFIAVNCAAIPENLLESELFGHVKGSFSGAVKDHKGLIESAHHGTLFLDEVGEISLQVQVKLLRFLQEGDCRRVGDTNVRKFDVRIISATNRNLEEAIKDKIFREDLFFRLSVIPIFLPPLRHRREDIPLLATHLLQRLCDTHSRNVSGISPGTLKTLLEYSWPGNVRELQNVMEYALHLTDDGQSIQNKQLPAWVREKENNAAREQLESMSIEEYTRQSICSLQQDHTEEQIASILGISRKNLWEKRKRWDISRPIR
ncbi:MAG: PAS domain-containing protein [bacterium]|nr:PAS domain-containing protein [bacterium]